MTNEEKAKEIANRHKVVYIAGLKNGRGTSFIECMSSAYQMAEWKDRQFKEYLEKKLEVEKTHNHGIESCTMRLLSNIINELFKEDLEKRADELNKMWLDPRPVNPWHKASEELPPINTEVVCKMKGVPHTEHFICKWDGEYWWHWSYHGQEVQGWFGLNEGWEVVEWKEI